VFTFLDGEVNQLIINGHPYLLTPTTVAGVKRSSASVSARVSDCSPYITQKRMFSKSSNGVQVMTLEYPTSGIWFLGQRSQGHKVQKHIEGDRVAGVSLHLYRVLIL